MIDPLTDHPLSCAGRTLTFDSFYTYQQIPKNVDVQNPGEDVRHQVLSCSKSFRDQLKVTVNEISIFAESVGENENQSTGNQSSLEKDYDSLYSIEKSWQICEIFCLNPSKLISIEFIKWLQELCYQVPLESYLTQFKHADEPESMTANSSSSVGYWDLVYQLVMQGNLVAARKLLSWHSEIATAISTREADGRSVSLALSSDAISRTQCDTLFDLLRSHPFADLGNTDVNTNNSTGSAANLVQEFTAWQARVRKFRQSKVAILTMIPELDTVLRILLGDLSTLEHHCELPAGAQAVGWETGWGWAKQATALLLYVHPPPLNKGDLYRVIEECMRKESKIGFADNSLSRGYIGTLREIMAGKIGPMLRGLYQTSLSDSPYRRYLSAVPLLCTAHLCLMLVTGAGKEDLLIPLADGPNESSFFEEIYLEVACRLHSLEFPVEVVLSYLAVCPMRGKEYARVLLPRSSMPSDRAVLSAAQTMRDLLDLPQEAAAVLTTRGKWWSKEGNVAKAAYFFQEAADEARLSVLVETSLQRCMRAVIGCRSAFPGLVFAPHVGNADFQDDARSFSAFPIDETSDDASMRGLEAAMVEAEELLHTVDGDAVEPGSILGLMLKSLSVYVQAVQDRFATSASSLRGAAQRLAALMIDHPTGPVLPVRYWLHTLELVAWYASCISSLESSGATDSSTTAPAGDDIQVEGEENTKSSPKPAQRPVLRKDQAYALLAKLKEVTTSYGESQLIGQGNGEALQALHLSLMGVLCSSTIKENALLGTQKASAGCAMNRAGYNKRVAVDGRAARLNQVWLSEHGRGREALFSEASLQRAEAFELLTGSGVGLEYF